MTKWQVVKILVLCVIVSWLFNIFAGRFLMAKFSTWPVLNRWHILSPQAPIVITNRETVRVSDSGDTVQAAAGLKSKISAIAAASGTPVSAVAASINLTSDGVFITAASAFARNPPPDYVVLNDGRMGKITSKISDPATGLIFFKADLANVPVANLGGSKDVQVGEKILFLTNSLQNFLGRADFGLANFSQADLAGQIFQSDYPRRSFGIQVPAAPENGEVLANTTGDIVGIYNGGAVISSDVLKQAMNIYFAGNGQISRPAFGFSYSIIGQTESRLTGQAPGASIKDILGQSAKQAGLISGDVIISVDGQNVSETSPLEEILEKYRPGDKLELSVTRGKQAINLTLTAGELK